MNNAKTEEFTLTVEGADPRFAYTKRCTVSAGGMVESDIFLTYSGKIQMIIQRVATFEQILHVLNEVRARIGLGLSTRNYAMRDQDEHERARFIVSSNEADHEYIQDRLNWERIVFESEQRESDDKTTAAVHVVASHTNLSRRRVERFRFTSLYIDFSMQYGVTIVSVPTALMAELRYIHEYVSAFDTERVFDGLASEQLIERGRQVA